jgi:diguanylate cyclase (GGDEF)-like protein/PAS domain S-box-containing protein
VTAGAVPSMEDLLQFLYLMPIGVVKFRADGAVDLINPVASALLLSLRADDTLQDVYASLAPLVPDLPQQVAGFAAVAGTIIDQQRLEACASGRAMVLALTVNRINANVFMVVLKDVTTLAEQERKLYADRRKFFAIFDHVRDYAIYTTTTEGKIDEWNQSVQRYGGWFAEDVRGRDLSLFLLPDDPTQPRIDLLLAEARRIGSVETEGWRVKRDGTRLWENTVITALPDETGTLRGFVVVSRDITERKRAEDGMKLLATADPLTGAYNRRGGEALLAAEFTRRARDGRAFAVLMLDVDHFKAVNDRFGHAAGDAVLCALVRDGQKALRAVDMLVRWGGEEFLVVLPDTDAHAAMDAAERMRAVLAATEVAALDGATIRFTVSVGVAVPTTDSPSELLRRADLALYAAKTGGRNRVVVAS